jgi:putative membrane protein
MREGRSVARAHRSTAASQSYILAGTVPDLATDTLNLRSGTPATERLALGGICLASAAAVAFLLWLLYFHHPPPAFARQWIFLPQLNALLNGLSAVSLCVGLYFIKRKKWRAHRVSMLLAFGFSSLFLASYIVNHALRGDTPFPGAGTARMVYLSILASHILCSIVALPMVLTTLYFALTRQFKAHRRLARITFPIWLYVSVTGVVVFVFLKAYAY